VTAVHLPAARRPLAALLDPGEADVLERRLDALELQLGPIRETVTTDGRPDPVEVDLRLARLETILATREPT
jgi:hypothetical protein